MYSTPELRNHEISSIPLQNPKTNENSIVRLKNHANHEVLRILRQNYESH